MLIVKDATVLIHLAKITTLAASCQHFQYVITPEKVYREMMKGLERGETDALIVEDMVKAGMIKIKTADDSLVSRVAQFNVSGGEAEAVALYWKENASFLATDDDNVRKKRLLLGVEVIGTPAILLALLKSKLISGKKYGEAVAELRKIGWFSNAVLDHALTEGKNAAS
jgi:predicted nucleic acid-binding protein